MKWKLGSVSAAALGLCAVAAFTSPAQAMFQYTLLDSSDGSLAGGAFQGHYGLRLDAFNLLFSFDDTKDLVQANVTMTITPTGGTNADVLIQGTMLEIDRSMPNDRSNDGPFWSLNYEINNATLLDTAANPAGFGYFEATTGTATAEGVINNLDPTCTVDCEIDLEGKADNTGVIVEFLASGRDDPGFAGWINFKGTNDFLATAAPVPVPAALPMLGAALAGLGFAARKRRQNA